METSNKKQKNERKKKHWGFKVAKKKIWELAKL